MKLTVDIPEKLHKAAKIAAVTKGVTLQALVIAALEAHLADKKR